MRTVLLWVIAIGALLAVALWIGFAVMTSMAADREWPAGLGKLTDAPKKNPPTWESESAEELVRLTAAAGIELRPGVRRSPLPASGEPRKALTDYVRAQLERSGDAIDAPPDAVAVWLAENAAPLDAVRDHLAGAEEVVWASDPRGEMSPVPNLPGHIQLERILVARALEKARHGDASAWQELRAANALSRALWQRPEIISIIVAVATSRMTNGAARKMPLPAPDWFGETLSFDYEREAWRAQQVETWRMRALGRGNPIEQYRAMREAERMRKITEEAIRTKVCDVTSPQFAAARAMFASRRTPSIFSAWQRILRFRVEREATQRVLQLRAGQLPSRDSRCSDGTWQVTSDSVKFTREIRMDAPTLNIPLQYSRAAR
jgi:hypothetical protein